jgi:hypothetical protein
MKLDYLKKEADIEHSCGEWLVDEFFHDDGTYSDMLELFIYSENSRQRGDGCEYYITSVGGLPEDWAKWYIEHKSWEFLVDDYKVASEVQQARLEWIEKRLALWLVESGGDSPSVLKAKKDLAKAEKLAKKTEKSLAQ